MQALQTAPKHIPKLSQAIVAQTQTKPVLLQAFKPEHMGHPPPPYWQTRTLQVLEHYLRQFLESFPALAADSPPSPTQHSPKPKPSITPQIFIIEACSLAAAVWRPLARELAKRLRQRQLPVQFLQCRDVPTHQLLGAWHEQPEQVLILVFGDSQRINTRQQRQAVQALQHWPQLLWFELRDPRAWDVHTWLLLQNGLRVYPAQVNSIVQACQDLLRQRPPRYTAQQLRGLQQRRQQARLPARIERILGDALPWAQACAMLPPPLGLGFAEQLRKLFFSHLSAQVLVRLCSLPELRRQGEAVYFSPSLLAVLRHGFNRQAVQQQEQILAFLQQQVAEAEPSARQQPLAHLEWQWYQARLQLDIEPDNALPQLHKLAQHAPLKALIEYDLAHISLPTHAHGQALYHRIPLRRAPQTRQALQILQSFANDGGLAPLPSNLLSHASQRLSDTWQQVQQRAVSVAAFSSDARWLAIGARDNSLVLWDSQRQQEFDLFHHDWFIAAENDNVNWWRYLCQAAYCGQLLLAFSPDNQRLATSLWDNTVRIWELQQRQLVYILKNHNLPLRALLFMPDSKRLLGVAAQGQVWDLARGQVLYKLLGHARLINHAALSADGDLLVTASARGHVRFWHSHSGEALRLLQAHNQAIYHLAFSPDNAYLVTCSADKTAKVWEVASGQLKHVCQGHKAAVSAAVFSPDGAWLLTTSQDKSVRIWDMHSGKQQQVLGKHKTPLIGAQFSADGQTILAVTDDLSIQAYSRDSLVLRQT